MEKAKCEALTVIKPTRTTMAQSPEPESNFEPRFTWKEGTGWVTPEDAMSDYCGEWYPMPQSAYGQGNLNSANDPHGVFTTPMDFNPPSFPVREPSSRESYLREAYRREMEREPTPQEERISEFMRLQAITEEPYRLSPYQQEWIRRYGVPSIEDQDSFHAMDTRAVLPPRAHTEVRHPTHGEYRDRLVSDRLIASNAIGDSMRAFIEAAKAQMNDHKPQEPPKPTQINGIDL